MTAEKLTCQETVELVSDYLEAALLPEMETLFEEHLGGCPHCTNYLDQMRQTIELLRRLKSEEVLTEATQKLLAKFRDWQKGSLGQIDV